MSGVAVATIIRFTSSGLTFDCSSALSAAFVAMSLVVSSFAAMRRSLIPVRVVIHSSEVSTIRMRSSFVSRFSGANLPVPTIETVRRVLAESGRGFERGCRFMITANLLDDMRVHLLFNRLGRDAQRILDRQRRARAVGDDADSIHAEQWTAAVLLVIGFVTNRAKRILRQKRAQFSHRRSRKLVFEPGENRDRDRLAGF